MSPFKYTSALWISIVGTLDSMWYNRSYSYQSRNGFSRPL